VIQRFRRYAELQPGNALAQYYYAVSLWKGKRVEDPGTDLGTVEALLKKAISLDDSLAEAHVQLGNLYADRHNYQDSIPQYERALALNPDLSDAHYRLATEYVQYLAQEQKERAEVQQFVYSEKESAASKP
jgi:tetratricopeptide (TPR) repeat protein